MTGEARIAELTEELAAANKVIEVLVRREERRLEALPKGSDQFAVLKAVANLEDIIEQRTRELYDSEQRYRALYNHSPDMLLAVGTDGRVSAANRTALRALPAELVGGPFVALFPGAEPDRIAALFDRERESREAELQLADGRHVSARVADIPGFRDSVLVVLRDVTEHRLLEAELAHARRLAAIGNLAAGVAHEINNPLAVVRLRVDMMGALDLPDGAQAQLDVLGHHVNRIARIVRNLQTFARPEAEVREAVRVVDLFAAARDLASAASPPAELEVDADPELAVRVDRGRMEQVLVNLLTNAFDALEGSGRVQLYARRRDESVELCVEDTGPGIADQLMDDLFAPFVTGKGPRGGTGLGLSIAWAIVQEHGGVLRASNRAEGGACFRFSVPVAEPSEARQEGPVAPAPRAASRALRVLCVDDEPALLGMLRQICDEAGHSVEVVPSGEAALEALAEREFDAILSDVRLPGMSGQELLARLEGRHPELARRTVLMSGLFLESAPCRFLQKPFDRRVLLDVLDEVTR